MEAEALDGGSLSRIARMFNEGNGISGEIHYKMLHGVAHGGVAITNPLFAN